MQTPRVQPHGEPRREPGASSRVLPSATQPLAQDIIRFIGGAPGAHAAIGGARWWTPLRVLLALGSFFLALAYLQKQPCMHTMTGSDGTVSLNTQGNRSFVAGCYSDVVPLFGGRGLDQLHFPYLYSWVENDVTRYMEYPVLTGLYQYFVALMGRGLFFIWEITPFPSTAPVVTYWIAHCFFLSVAWLVTVVAMKRLLRNRVWDTVLLVTSPLLIVHAFTNWDILAIMACVLGLFFWSRGRSLSAGVALGLGVALKLWPLFALGALALLCLRARRMADLLRLVAAAVVAWSVVNLPIYLLSPRGWAEFYHMSATRGFEGSTIYQVAANIAKLIWGHASPQHLWLYQPNHVSMVSFVLLLPLLAGLTWLVLLRCPTDRVRVGHVVFLAVAAFLLTSKVWSPQFSLWLLPLIVLAIPRWWLVYLWGSLEAVYWYIRLWQFLPDKEHPPVLLVDLLTMSRIALIVFMAVLVIRQMCARIPDEVLEDHGGQDPLSCWNDPESAEDTGRTESVEDTVPAKSEPAGRRAKHKLKA